MALFSRSHSSALKKALSKLPFFKHKGGPSLALLNITQFLGVVNDNLFKFVMAFLLIDALGRDSASTVLAATGAIYVIPFLLFSASAGIVADRFSKQKLLVIMKIAEMLIMILAFFAFAFVNVAGCYVLLFLLSTHSAMFGPSKYGIIPELVPSDRVSRANGLVTAFTYLAIILGTFLAPFFTEITNRRFSLIALICFAIALAGFCSSLFIQRTAAQGSKKRVNPLFIKDILITLKSCVKIPHLLPAIFGSAFFLFLGGFTQLNIIPYAMQCLHLPEISGGYLFLITALGIALGSYLAGRMSKKRIELGLPCLAGFAMSFFFILLAIFPENTIKTIIALMFIGIFGGMFIVPFDTFIQVISPDAQRGQTIAAANFLSFFGVLIASGLIYVFPNIFSLSPANGFAVIGGITLLVSCVFVFLLSDLFLSYVSRIFLQRIFRCLPPKAEEIQQSKNTILVLEHATWKQAFLLFGIFPHMHLIIPHSHPKCCAWLLRLFYCFHPTPESDAKQLIEQAKTILKAKDLPCLFLPSHFPKEHVTAAPSFFHFFQKKPFHLAFVRFERDSKTGHLMIKTEVHNETDKSRL